VSGNGTAPPETPEDREYWARVVAAFDRAREDAEAGVVAIEVGTPVIQFVAGIARQLAEPFPEDVREEVIRAVARGCAAVLQTALDVYFRPVAE